VDFVETPTRQRMPYVYRSLLSSSIAVHGIFVPDFPRARVGYVFIPVSSPDVGWPCMADWSMLQKCQQRKRRFYRLGQRPGRHRGHLSTMIGLLLGSNGLSTCAGAARQMKRAMQRVAWNSSCRWTRCCCRGMR